MIAQDGRVELGIERMVEKIAARSATNLVSLAEQLGESHQKTIVLVAALADKDTALAEKDAEIAQLQDELHAERQRAMLRDMNVEELAS